MMELEILAIDEMNYWGSPYYVVHVGIPTGMFCLDMSTYQPPSFRLSTILADLFFWSMTEEHPVSTQISSAVQ